MAKLAIKGGTPIRSKDNVFPPYTVIGVEEKDAALRVLDSGILSKYLGCWDPDFYGGIEVQAFEKEWAEKFAVKHAVAMNSATSGLIAAVGALGISPGDEVIVSPYTMCASASAPLFYGAIPVFADVEPEYFCLDPKSVEAAITPRTRAIIVVDIFGAPHDSDAINAIARKRGIAVIADTAQSPGALYKGKHAGTLSDIGVYSLNYHKHIHTGEGGMVVTNDEKLAERLRLIRNHAEGVIGEKGTHNLVNMVGFNFRLTEIQAAIGREQLKKLGRLIKERQKNCAYLSEKTSAVPCIKAVPTRPECTHVYYIHPFLYDEKIAGIARNLFIDAVKAELPTTTLRESEGPLLSSGYEKPLYLLPLFQKQTAFGKNGYPFRGAHYKGFARYEKGTCPVAEELYEKKLFYHEMMRPGMAKKDLDDVAEAFKKVYNNRHELL